MSEKTDSDTIEDDNLNDEALDRVTLMKSCSACCQNTAHLSGVVTVN